MRVGTRVTAIVATALAAPLLAFTAAQMTAPDQQSDVVVAEFLHGWHHHDGHDDCYDNDCWNEGGDNDRWNEHNEYTAEHHNYGHGGGTGMWVW